MNNDQENKLKDFCKDILTKYEKDLIFFKGLITKKVLFFRQIIERIFIKEYNVFLVDIIDFKIIDNYVQCSIVKKFSNIKLNMVINSFNDFLNFYYIKFCYIKKDKKMFIVDFRETSFNEEKDYCLKCKLLINIYKNKIKFFRNKLFKKIKKEEKERENIKKIEDKLNRIIKIENDKIEKKFHYYFK